MKTKSIFKAFTCLFVLFATNTFAQNNSDSTSEIKHNAYCSFSTEMIFSFATIDNNGNADGNIMRWAPFFNPQFMFNYDFNKIFGLYTGMAVRNVGFIYENPFDSNNTKYKYRTYNFGIPVGFKIGNLQKMMFFGGYEIEFPFVYKEKQFVNENKEEKNINWFSDKVEPVQHSLMAGVQIPFGITFKFKYYLTNFHNRDYIAMDNGVETKPYDFKTNVLYFSIAWNVFRNMHDYVHYK